MDFVYEKYLDTEGYIKQSLDIKKNKHISVISFFSLPLAGRKYKMNR